MVGSPETADRGDTQGDRLDWSGWHAAYDRPSSPLARRLELVQKHTRAVLDGALPGPIRAVSVCAGQGHDLIGVLADHPRRADVFARLVELDEDNVAAARLAAASADLGQLEIVAGDASLTDSYMGAVPAQLILLCGVLGNISVSDVARTVEMLPQLCAGGASVVWTRRRSPPDLLPELLAMFAAAGFKQVALDTEPTVAVGTSVLTRQPDDLVPGTRMFDFIGQGALWPHLDTDRRSALQALFRPDCTLLELVEAMRALPIGGPPDQTAEAMLREGRGTPLAKHSFLLEVLRSRFPATRPVLLHRLYTLDRGNAATIYGEKVARVVPAGGIAHVHTYLTLTLDDEVVSLDVTSHGPSWDGHSALPPVCGPGEDRPAGEDPSRSLAELLRAGAGPIQQSILDEISLAGLPQPQPEP
jgi:hypothetical protein